LTSARSQGLRFSLRSPFYFAAGPQYAPACGDPGFATLAFNNILWHRTQRNGTGVLILQRDETFAGGRQDYQVPFKFTGKLKQADALDRAAEVDALRMMEGYSSPVEASTCTGVLSEATAMPGWRRGLRIVAPWSRELQALGHTQ
jgi:hypothetical protein